MSSKVTRYLKDLCDDNGLDEKWVPQFIAKGIQSKEDILKLTKETIQTLFPEMLKADVYNLVEHVNMETFYLLKENITQTFQDNAVRNDDGFPDIFV